METNETLVGILGTAAWALAFVVLLLVGLPAHNRWWLWVCVTGVVIGLFALWYVPRLHRGRAAAALRHAGRNESRPPTS
jgi:polyferredoxin